MVLKIVRAPLRSKGTFIRPAPKPTAASPQPSPESDPAPSTKDVVAYLTWAARQGMRAQ